MIEGVSTGIPVGVTYNDVRYACWRAGIKCDMRSARKIFASHLRQSGI